MHKSGYICLIGRPNAGKSTLLNTILDEKLVIISHKSQTTRHRIFGIYNDNDHQIVFSDTPGLISPDYELHKRMMGHATKAIEDSEIALWLVDVTDEPEVVLSIFNTFKIKKKLYLVINKVESSKQKNRVKIWHECFKDKIKEEHIFLISAKENIGVSELLIRLKTELPEAPPYYDKEDLAVAQTRFFISEFIRETIFEQYEKEIPYQTAVVISQYKETESMHVIHAEIIVERESQKSILIGSGGRKIKELGMKSREKIEKFLGIHCFLDLRVKIRNNWRNKDMLLDEYGY